MDYHILVYCGDSDESGSESDLELENDDPKDLDYEMESKEVSPDVTLDYKKKTVEFANTPLKSGKAPKISSVLNRFKNCKSPLMLHRWKEQISKSGISFSFWINSLSLSQMELFLFSTIARYLYLRSLLGGSVRDKQKLVDDFVLMKFNEVRSNYGIVHEVDLRRWAIEKSREVISIFSWITFLHPVSKLSCHFSIVGLFTIQGIIIMATALEKEE